MFKPKSLRTDQRNLWEENGEGRGKQKVGSNLKRLMPPLGSGFTTSL